MINIMVSLLSERAILSYWHYIYTGWSCGNPSTMILSLNCSKYANSLEDTFHPYKLNESETDYCIKCLCDKVNM